MRLGWVTLSAIALSCSTARDYGDAGMGGSPESRGGSSGAGGNQSAGSCSDCGGAGGSSGASDGGAEGGGDSTAEGGGAGAKSPPDACTGCLIDAVCIVPGARNPENVCELCEPNADEGRWTPDDGHSCDDGSFCTISDTCKDGLCQGGEERECDDDVACNGVSKCDEAAGRCIEGQTTCVSGVCDESTDTCRPTCSGCLIGSNCVASGETQPGDPCRVCEPTKSTQSYSPNPGANCGAGPSECSAQDTCDAAGVCKPNDLAQGQECTGGECTGGVCQLLQNPFDCILPQPPTVKLPSEIFRFESTPPPASKGGTITPGKYVPIRLNLYTTVETVTVRTFEFAKGGFVQIGAQPYGVSNGAGWIPQFEFAGTFKTSGTELAFTLERCDPGINIDVPKFGYTASANGITLVEVLSDGTWLETQLLRQ